MTHEQKLMWEAGVAADKRTIISNLLREMNSAAVKSHISNSQINIFLSRNTQQIQRM